MSLQEILAIAARAITDPRAGFGEPVGVLAPGAAEYTVNAAVQRFMAAAQPEAPNSPMVHRARLTFADDAQCGLALSALDVNRWKIRFALVAGQEAQLYPIARLSPSTRPGIVTLEIG